MTLCKFPFFNLAFSLAIPWPTIPWPDLSFDFDLDLFCPLD